jgi:hypothetical protein
MQYADLAVISAMYSEWRAAPLTSVVRCVLGAILGPDPPRRQGRVGEIRKIAGLNLTAAR